MAGNMYLLFLQRLQNLNNYTMRNFKLLVFFITILVTPSYFGSSQPMNKKIMKLLIMNDNNERPIVTGVDYFWKSKHIDTISFSGDLYFDLVKYNLSKLKQDKVKNNFTVQVALLFFQKDKCDTVYADSFFTNWLIGENSFTASDEFLEKMFNSLYLGVYKDMRKGVY